MNYFEYGEKEVAYLKSKDKKLAEVINIIGHINRPVDDDLFSSVIHHIVGQQISTKAQQTIWNRIHSSFEELTPERIDETSLDQLQSFGITYRKAGYIKDFARKIQDETFDLDAVRTMSDDEAIAALSSLSGIGVWTAEMILLFCLQRPNILSYKDLAIHRGLRMVYHHRNIDKKLFMRYHRRYFPYSSVASLYLWAVAGGAIPGMKDYAPKKKG